MTVVEAVVFDVPDEHESVAVRRVERVTHLIYLHTTDHSALHTRLKKHEC